MSAPRAAWWTLTVVLAALPLAIIAARSDSAGAQAAVAPVLSCPAGMALDSATGSCRTPRTETVLRPAGCQAGSTQVPGEYGGHVCQTKVTKQIDTGQTRQVHSHSTFAKVWVPTGTKQVQTGTNRVWVPPRTMVEPLAPPVRVQVGTRTESKTVTRPGPDVLYEVAYTVDVTTKRVVRRCSFDPIADKQCWNQTVTETTTQTRTRLECCIPGPPVTTTVTREVPVYGYRTTHTVTVPGYWSETPVYETRETGYWDRVETRHYTQERVYETQVTWSTSAATQGPCPTGWQPAGSQCSRTVLGAPSAAPTQQCPSGSVPRYGDALGGVGPSVLTCQSSAPGSNPDSGDDQEDSGGGENSPDGGARPLHHLASESDERLAELGIHRCANGLLSYVPCDELPGRTWDSDPDVCDGIEGTTYRSDHGGTCVTQSDLLNKCTKPGDCEETTIRTYCPAIGELATTQIQEHAHPHRGAETYRVCVFDCTSFGTLPEYVQTRINGSYDYACLPTPDDESSPTATTSPTTTTTPEDDEAAEEDPDDEDEVREEVGDDPDDPPDVTGPDVTAPDVTVPDTTVTTGGPTVTTAADPGDGCASTPSATAAASALGGLTWVSHVRTADARRSTQRHLPGGGSYLQVAPGRGWAEVRGPVDVSEGECGWTAAWVRVQWSEQRPWVIADRRAMEASAGTRHLVKRWDELSADQQQLVRQWRRIVREDSVCTVGDASGPAAAASCGWALAHPAAYVWQASICFEPDTPSGTSPPRQQRSGTPAAGDACWVSLASGLDWVRSVSDYADGRVTLTGSEGGS
ncbi:MAG: hypothetical protein F4064_00735 [Acidimicrobiales bacterium]|nr:hypothetical protein [Acidimicrobiales bacterium]